MKKLRPIDAAVDFVRLLALVALVAVFGTLSETPTLLLPKVTDPEGVRHPWYKV